ncbi:transcription factor [Ganoderma sinense ZZ0214-1]|uniref:Transcription factor n=1 Tax=Ganoderma sinense ZZ0214-1 TaxID=1077348 RepID=A0A2G8SKB7_9APHY|nr:transcription factor [Ganoderma sinense ZZ0214-1]
MATDSDSPFFDSSLAQMDAAALGSFLSSVSSPLYPSTGSSTLSETSGLDDSPPSDLSPEHAACASRSSSESPVRLGASTSAGRKRVRPKIDLAPGQPPTARGNPRIRVFVACRQCRARKVRCDGAKPVCCNCQKRPSGAEQCSYDSGPNRRGREKGSTRARNVRGMEQKTSKPISGRQAQDAVAPPPPPDQSPVQAQNDAPSSNSDLSPMVVDLSGDDDAFDFSDEMTWEYDPLLYDVTYAADMDMALLPGVVSTLDGDFALLPEPTIVVTPPEDQNVEEEAEEAIPSRPSAQFARDTWWDALLSFYADDFGFGASDMQVIAISHTQRNMAMKAIMADLRALFGSSPCWTSFLHLPRFFDSLFSPVRRKSLQPSLMLASLALGTLCQSSEAEYGSKGRDKALRLLDMANGAIEASLATGWVDIGLAQAALMIVFFEMHTHPKQTFERSRSSLLLVDSLIRLFGLTRIDEDQKPRGLSPYAVIQPQGYDPVAHMGGSVPPQQNANFNWSTGTPGRNPTPFQPFQGQPFVAPSNSSSNFAGGMPSGSSASPHHHNHPPGSQGAGCNCIAISLGHNWPSVNVFAPAWRGTEMWPEGLSEGEFRREESRRIVWSSVMAVANLNAYTVAVPDSLIAGFEKLLVREPEKFALLFPSEVLARTGRMVQRDDIWTLNYRTMLLLHVIMRTRENRGLSLAERAQLSVQAWIEIDDIEQRLNYHTCDMDSVFGFQARELLFAMRMLTSYEFQRYIPQVTTAGSTLFYRDKAEEWLKYIDMVGDWIWKSVSQGAHSPTRDHRKSLLLYWHISNIRKALALWKTDHGLINALEFAKRCAAHTEFLLMLWPNSRLRYVWQELRYQLVAACLEVGIPPPPPSLPPPIQKVDPAPVDADFTDLILSAT